MSAARGDPPFGRVITAMVTPFDTAGELDVDGAARLASYLADHGSDALVIGGSTGEAMSLTDSERLELWKVVVGAVDVPILAGATTADTRHSVELVQEAAAIGVDGILAVAPYYSRPPQAGIEAHFRAIAAASELPVVLYDIPVRTGRQIAPETLVRLAEGVDTIVGWKDALGNPVASGRVMARLPEGFVCYSGDDHATLPLLSLGAVGLISVAAHWCGPECSEMINRFLDGDVDGALEVGRALIPSFDFESGDDAPNPIPTKAVMRLLGLPAGQCRLPNGVAPPGVEERAKVVLAELDAWRASRD